MFEAIWSNAEKIAAITTSISVVFVVIVLILTRKQVQSALGASAIQIFELIYTDLNKKESRNNRRFVYSCNLLPKEIYANELANSKVESVCVSLDRVGVMLRNKLVPKGPARNLYFDMYVDVFIRCWEKLKDYVSFIREKKTSQHYRNFEYLAKTSKKYWKKEFGLTKVDIPSSQKRYALQDGENPFIIHSTRIICDKPQTWFRVRADKLEDKQTGKQFEYTIAEIGPSVGIVALDSNENLCLVGQWRYTLNKYSWEIPTGVIEPGENELAAAKRELLEETGLEANNWIKLGTIDNSNGSTIDEGHLFFATGLTQLQSHRDPHEIIKTGSISLLEAIELVYENRITESLSIAAILKAAHYLTTNDL